MANLEELLKKRDQLNAQIQKQKAFESKKRRADDTRRKVLIGGSIIRAIEKGDFKQEDLDLILDTHLIRTQDREFMKVDS